MFENALIPFFDLRSISICAPAYGSAAEHMLSLHCADGVSFQPLRLIHFRLKKKGLLESY